MTKGKEACPSAVCIVARQGRCPVQWRQSLNRAKDVFGPHLKMTG